MAPDPRPFTVRIEGFFPFSHSPAAAPLPHRSAVSPCRAEIPTPSGPKVPTRSEIVESDPRRYNLLTPSFEGCLDQPVPILSGGFRPERAHFPPIFFSCCYRRLSTDLPDPVSVSAHDFLKSFSCNTYASPPKCCKQKTYGAAKPFRCNTYKNTGEGSRLWLSRFPIKAGVRYSGGPRALDFPYLLTS